VRGARSLAAMFTVGWPQKLYSVREFIVKMASKSAECLETACKDGCELLDALSHASTPTVSTGRLETIQKRAPITAALLEGCDAVVFLWTIKVSLDIGSAQNVSIDDPVQRRCPSQKGAREAFAAGFSAGRHALGCESQHRLHHSEARRRALDGPLFRKGNCWKCRPGGRGGKGREPNPHFGRSVLPQLLLVPRRSSAQHKLAIPLSCCWYGSAPTALAAFTDRLCLWPQASTILVAKSVVLADELLAGRHPILGADVSVQMLSAMDSVSQAVE
jgi:hypothetical protein